MSEALRFDLIANDRASRVFNDVGGAADRTTSKFKNFAKVGALAVAAGAVVAGRALVGMAQSAADDERAQTTLANSMKNAANASKGQIAATEAWITAQGKAKGIADDDLRPALSRLVQATGDVHKSQKLAGLAMDISAGTGKSLKSVTDALAKAQTGSLAGLSKMGVAVKDAAGEEKSLATITQELAGLHGGQAAAAADTNAGKMARLKVIYDEIKESIGAKLIPVMGDAADKAMKFIDEMQKGVGTGGKVRDVMENIGDALGTVKNNFGTIAPLLATVTGGMVAYSAATKIASVITAIQAAGTTAATGATWSLNAALRANPIGLVVTALTLLVGGMVLAYKKSETFRDIINGAWDAVKSGASAMWSGIKSTFGAFEKGFEALGKAGVWLWNNALQPAFKFIVNGVGNILDMWASMLSVLGKVPGFGWAKDAAEAMGKAADKAHAMADGITKIPSTKKVTITVVYAYQGKRNPAKEDQLDFMPRGKVETESIKLGELFSSGFAGGVKAKIKTAIAAVSELASRSADKLQTLKDKATEIASGVADAMRGALDVGALGGTDADGNRLNVTDQLANFAAQSGQFAAALAAAAGKGLNSGLIQKIAQLGPTQGLTAAEALAAMDQAQVASANASLAAVDMYANQLGQTVLTTTTLPADIAREQANHDALVAILTDLKNNPGNINITVNDATDPDAVVAAIRKYIKRNGKLHGVAAKDD